MQGLFNITANRNIQGHKITNVKANIITTDIIWIVFFFCLFVSPSGFRLRATKTVCKAVCVSSFWHVGEWSTSASIIILLVFKSVFPCFMERTTLSTASRVTPCCGVWSWSHWMRWISPAHLSGRTPCAKCVRAVPLRKFDVQWLSEFLISYLWRRGSVAACWVFIVKWYRWSSSRFFKRHTGKDVVFLLLFPMLMCISSLLKCIFYIISQIGYCSNFDVGRIHEI